MCSRTSNIAFTFLYVAYSMVYVEYHYYSYYYYYCYVIIDRNNAANLEYTFSAILFFFTLEGESMSRY